MKPVLLAVHGWGGSKHSFDPLRAALATADVEILTPDLPGFGDEPEPTEAWTVERYANWVQDWLLKQYSLDELKNRRLAYLGHSHGGRIGLVLASRESLPLSHLYLCATAGVSRTGKGKRGLGMVLAKTGKVLLSIPGLKALEPMAKKTLYKVLGVHDYEKASPVMKETITQVIGEDLTPLLSSIHVPTDIFWGEQDTQTPMEDAYVLHKAIKDSNVHIYPGIRHAVHKEKANEIAQIMTKTLLS